MAGPNTEYTDNFSITLQVINFNDKNRQNEETFATFSKPTA